MPEKEDFLIIIGASAGGLTAVAKLLSQLDPGIPAAIGVVLHLPENAESQVFLAKLKRSSALPCHLAAHQLPVKNGHVYLAPAGYHMLIKENDIVLGNGPAEGRWRPSINASFRSAAAAKNSHCIGIVLTGMLDDGTTGMDAIRRCGGFTIVQDPDEADYPNMPRAVLNKMKVDRCLPLSGIPAAITEYITSNPAPRAVPEDVRIENQILELVATEADRLRPLGEPALFSCPECGGGLWEIKSGQVSRYRCHIGHGYTEHELLQGQQNSIESTLWVALRVMEEKRNLLQKIATQEQEQGLYALSGDHHKRAEEMHRHIHRLKDLIFTQKQADLDEPAA
jgi:two-component system chemotaxis response regulator CheB